jgi:transcriptional regulator with XRE-family HTH domain
VQILRTRSGLSNEEFASRIGVSREEFAAYLNATVSPAASLMIRMRRLSDRFAKIRAQQAQGATTTEPDDEYPEPD